jgi:hypothetical protein
MLEKVLWPWARSSVNSMSVASDAVVGQGVLNRSNTGWWSPLGVP